MDWMAGELQLVTVVVPPPPVGVVVPELPLVVDPEPASQPARAAANVAKINVGKACNFICVLSFSRSPAVRPSWPGSGHGRGVSKA